MQEYVWLSRNGDPLWIVQRSCSLNIITNGTFTNKNLSSNIGRIKFSNLQLTQFIQIKTSMNKKRKGTCHWEGSYIPKSESEERRKNWINIYFLPESWKFVKHEENGIEHSDCVPWNCLKEDGKEMRWTGDQNKNRDHPDYSAAKIS